MTTWQALKEAGWWTTYDWIMTGCLVALWVTTFFWLIFSVAESRILTLIVVLLISLSLKALWIVSLVFRCAWFVLKAHADIAMLPYSAARIAAAYLAGKK